MLLGLAATLAIVVQDHTSLRSAPQSSSAELTTLWQGDVLEIRGERAGYLKVYNYRRERGGYIKSESARQVGLGAADATELLAVLRFLRETPGSEALGISYGAAYLRAVPPQVLTAEPFDAIARMAERLADQLSGNSNRLPDVAAHLEVVEQFGVHMRSFERNGRVQVCYDGELFRRVLALKGSLPEQRAHAALGLTRTDCIDPNLGPVPRATLDEERRDLLEEVDDRQLSAMLKSRLHIRRAAVWASVAFEQARRHELPEVAAQRALAELQVVHLEDLGEDGRTEYEDALVRVSAIRWAAATPLTQPSPLSVSLQAGDPGQTCVALQDSKRRGGPPLVRRCTYGIVWESSAQSVGQGQALVLAVQPLENWRELWVFHQSASAWTIDVLSPGADETDEGFIEFAGFVPGTERLLVAREVKERGRFRRRFEVLRLDDLALVRQASTPELLRDFGRWADITWRRDSLALH